MRRRVIAIVVLAALLCVLLCACGEKVDGEADGESYTIEANDSGVLKTYSYSAYLRCYSCDGMKYTYKLTLSGRMPNAEKDSTFVVLSNVEDITFEQAYLQFTSSNTADLFDPQDAVVVEMR
ncbi:MAG: immunogenic protein [Clostridia bacterium]|nr:immunogenic protein [Clostridia bacterium]